MRGVDRKQKDDDASRCISNREYFRMTVKTFSRRRGILNLVDAEVCKEMYFFGLNSLSDLYKNDLVCRSAFLETGSAAGSTSSSAV